VDELAPYVDQFYWMRGEISPYHAEIQEKKRLYSYYEPNREFSGLLEFEKLKKVDDGTYTDCGYR
jgi:hypothetical protein